MTAPIEEEIVTEIEVIEQKAPISTVETTIIEEVTRTETIEEQVRLSKTIILKLIIYI